MTFKRGDKVWCGTPRHRRCYAAVVMEATSCGYVVRIVSQPTGVLVDVSFAHRLVRPRTEHVPGLDQEEPRG